MIRARSALLLALGAVWLPCAHGDEVTIGALKDNTLFSEDATFGTNTSDGVGPYMYIGQTNSNGARRALIAFDITSAIPQGATIDSATLSFNVSRGNGSQSITLHRLLQDWGEGTSNSGDPGGGGVPAGGGDATWLYHHFFSVDNAQPWTTPGGDFATTVSASGTAAAMNFILGSTPEMVADVQQWRNSPSTNFGWILVGQEDLFGAADRIDSRENTNPTFRPTLTIDFSLSTPTPTWNVDADGSWGDANNWGGTVPDSPTAVANLAGKITAPRTISLDGDRTIGTLNFNHFIRYTIAPGTPSSSTLTLGGPGAPGAINLNPATHEISAKLIVAAAGTINVPGDGRLLLSGGLQINDSTALLMTGDGDLTLSGPQTHQSGASLTINNLRLLSNSNAGAPAEASSTAVRKIAGALASASTAASAPLAITISGGPGVFMSTLTLGASQDLNSLTINYMDEGTQAVDLNSNETEFHALRIHGGDLDGAKSTLAAAIQNARINGEGIYDSGLHAGAAIGIAKLVDAHGDDYVLIRPTRIGDLNLDGAVSISDFIDLASHFNSIGGWQEGDLNGDALVTISDFIDLASNFNTVYVGSALPISAADQLALDAFAAAHGVSLVPEPASLTILLGAAFLRRRRRQ